MVLFDVIKKRRLIMFLNMIHSLVRYIFGCNFSKTICKYIIILMASRYYEYNNSTFYGFESDALRYTWAGYFLFIIISSLVGNTAILIASMKYKAFKFHRAIIIIIEHLAVCDLMVVATDVVPKLVSLIANKQVLGNHLCLLSPYARFYFNLASLFLICTMTSSKLLLLKYPLRFGTTTEKQTHMICMASWLAAFAFPIAFLIVDRHDIYFSYRTYKCTYGFSSEIWMLLKNFLALFFIHIPVLLVVATTVHLLIIAKQFARRNRQSLKWQGITTSVLTATIYCISVLPVTLYYIGEAILKGESKILFHTHCYRVANSFVFLNTISNFYIYSLTVDRFREFVRTRMLQCATININSTNRGKRLVKSA